MRNRILQIVALFATLTAILVLQKPIFTLFVGGFTFAETLKAMTHGISMDMSVAGYLTAIPALTLILTVWVQPKWLSIVAKAYFWLISLLMSLTCICNCGLYTHWGFPLETSPVFYILSSPVAAAASEPWWVWSLGIVLILALAYLYFWIIKSVLRLFKIKPIKKKKWLSTIVLTIVTGILFLPIRGGVTVSTMNLSRAYFSSNQRLNHAAVNPLFSFLYSATHQRNFGKEFQYYDKKEAQKIFTEMSAPKDSGEEKAPLPNKPDIILIILESFSAHLMPSLGGEPIAMQLDSIAKEGLLFTNFYASSFRTDRAIPSIVSAYPAQPTTSLLKFTSKIDSLPSIAAELGKVGYITNYYYGGDLNYTNIKAMLVSGKYDNLVGDTDFPVSQRMSKWGVHDEYVFQRLLTDIQSKKDNTPTFSVLQTSSSHEPFEVPYRSHFTNDRVNAFAYADSCLGAFYDELKKSPNFDNTLVIITPDHYGAYPQNLDDPLQRHHIPLVIAGGAAKKLNIDPTLLTKPGSQTDIAATILSLVGADLSNFKFSHNLLSSSRKPFAFFSEPSWIAMVTEDGKSVISVDTGKPIGQSDEDAARWLKAYIQTLYLDLDAR